MRNDLPPDPGPADPRDAFFDVAGLTKGMGRRAGDASIKVLALSMAKVVLLFGGIAILARLIPPAEYGIFALALPAVAIALSLSNFGLPQAIVQRKAITHAEVSTLFWLNTIFAIIAGLVIVAIAGRAARLFDQPDVADVYRVVSVAVVLAAMTSQYAAIMRRRLQTATFEAYALVGEAVGLAVAIAAALAGWSYWALVAQQIAAQATPLALGMLRTGWLPSAPWTAKVRPVLDAIQFGGYIAGVGVLNRLITYTGTAIAGAQLNPAAVGLYTRAVRLGNIPSLRIMTPLAGTMVPAFSRLQEDAVAFRALFVRMVSRANLLLMPAAVLVAAGADPIVAILMGQQWAAAAPLLFWLSIMTLRAGTNHGMRYALISHGHSRALFFNTVARFAVVAVAIYLAAPHGLEAMTAAYMLAELFITLPMIVAQALIHTPVTLRTIWDSSLKAMLMATALAGLLIVLVNPVIDGLPPLVQLVVLGGLTGATYAAQIALNPGMRRDVTGVLDRLRAKLPFGRRPA